MTLGFPLGLLALAALAPLLAAYFLRKKQPPRVVSALFLWRTRDLRAEAGPRFERFSRETSLALETLAICAAALFLADAQCAANAPRRHVVVVVDGSLSMAAKTDGKTVAERVKDAVAKLAVTESAAVLTIVESGVKPSLLAGPQLEADRALAQLEAWRPAQPAHDFAPALLMARELASSREQRIHFFTDGPVAEPGALPPQVQVRSLGKAADNLAFLSAQRRDEGGVATVTVRVASFSKEKRKVPVRFSATDVPVQTQALELAPGGTAVVRVGFKTSAPIEATLPDDALAEDSRVLLLPSPVADVTVGFLEGLDASAIAALKRVFAIAPGLRFETPAALTFGPPGSKANVTLGAGEPVKSFVGPFFTQKGDALLDDVQLGGVVWTAGPNPPGRALASAGEVVLLSQEDDGALHLNLDVGKSNIQRTVAWPVLVGNVLRQARLSSPGLPRKHVMLGEDVPVVTTAGATWVLKGPQGQERAVLGIGSLTALPLNAPGRWTLEKDGKPFDALEALPLDPHESNLSTRGPYQVDASVGEALASLALKRPRAWWPLALFLAFMLLDYWLTVRVPGGRAVQAPARGAKGRPA